MSVSYSMCFECRVYCINLLGDEHQIYSQIGQKLNIELPVMDKVCVLGSFSFFFHANLISGNSYMIVDAFMEPDPFIFSWIAMLNAFLETLSRLRRFFLYEERDLELTLI